MSLKIAKRLLVAVAGMALSSMVLAAPTFVTIGSGSTSGLYYPTAVGIAKIINESDADMRANARSTGASVFNANAIGEGSLQMGIVQNNIAHYALEGEGVEAFEGKPVENLRGMASLYPEQIHILARTDSEIEGIGDLAGKRVYVGDVGSGTEADAHNILAAYDISFDDLKSTVRGSSGDAVNLLRDDRIDAMFYTVGLGSSAIVEAAQTAPITILSIDDDKLADLTDEYSFYTEFTIPGGTYPDVNDDEQTITLQAMLAVSADMTEDDVYTFMKTVWDDNLDTFYEDVQNPNLKKYFKVEDALNGMSIPLHPGAVKFYEEQGVEVPDDLQPSA